MRTRTLYVNAGARRNPDGTPRGNRSHRNERVTLRRSLSRDLRAELADL